MALTFSLFNIDNFSKSQVYGHDFIPNESASFLSFANQLQAESELVQSNLDNDNLTLAEEHATRAIELLNSKDPINNVAWRDEIAERNQRVANELVTAISSLENITMSSPEQQQSANLSIDEIDAIIDEAVTTRIDRDQRANATIQATALGDIINTLLRFYGNAYEVGFDMGNMSEMASMIGNSSSNTNYTLANVAAYQSAQALATKAQEIFNNELRPLADRNATNSIAKLEDGLIQLSNLIESKSSPMQLVMVGHSQVHPSLQSAFNLRLQVQM
ncbi:MAG TPA: hypothetical protein VE573_11740 [Nitrososphaeraceae archaeon]|nr:hypothetical protein [Nitrososphaeraceae archaeon]